MLRSVAVRLRCLCVALVLAALGLPGTTWADAGVLALPNGATRAPAPDAGVPAQRSDAGSAGASVDAGSAGASVDAGRRRRRRPRDAGVDASVPGDAGALSATSDGGLGEDAGVAADAGAELVDAGVPEDAAAAPAEPREPVVPMPTAEELATAIEQRTADAPVIEAPPEAPPASAESTVFAIKLIFGLAILLALAYIGGHPRVRQIEEALGIRGVVLAGFPFVALGVIASLPSVGILTDEVIPKLRPVLQFGLGWIGFIVGSHLDIRVLDRVPRGSAYLTLIESIAPFGVTAVVCGAVMIGVFGLSPEDPAAWRDILLLGTAAAMTGPRKFHGFAIRLWHEGRSADVLLFQIDEIVGVVGLLFITAYFRGDPGSAWDLPGTAWLFVAVGLGVVIGVVIFATIRLPRSTAEFLAIVLGTIAFATGLASVLRLSPVVTCFIAGALITNFPNEQRDSVFRILNRLERPIHLLFLMIAGALWNVFDWRGWVLVPLFVVCRIAGKWLGVITSRFALRTILPAEFTERRQLVLPMSMMAIALVVSIERFRDVGLPWVITAVIGGAIVFELLVPSRSREEDEPEGAAREPIDELDRGPIYDRDPS